MTIKQRQFVKKYIQNGGNGTKAALEVYNTSNRHVAESIGCENLRKPEIKREIELALEHAGVTDDYISELLRESTVAGLGQKATNADTLRGIELMLKLKGTFPPRNQRSAHLRVEMKEQLDKKSLAELKEEVKRLSERTNQLLEDINS